MYFNVRHWVFSTAKDMLMSEKSHLILSLKEKSPKRGYFKRNFEEGGDKKDFRFD